MFAEASDAEKEEFLAKKKQFANDPRKEMLTTMGQRIAGNANPDEVAGLFETAYAQNADFIKQNIRRSGTAKVFGENMDQTLSIKQMLQSGAGGMGAEGKRLAKKLKLAKTPEEEAAIIEESPGREPTPAHIRTVIDTVRRYGCRAVFAEPQFSPKAAEAIASESGAQVLFLDPLGGPGLPDRDTYLKLMRYNLAQMTAAMR